MTPESNAPESALSSFGIPIWLYNDNPCHNALYLSSTWCQREYKSSDRSLKVPPFALTFRHGFSPAITSKLVQLPMGLARDIATTWDYNVVHH